MKKIFLFFSAILGISGATCFGSSSLESAQQFLLLVSSLPHITVPVLQAPSQQLINLTLPSSFNVSKERLLTFVKNNIYHVDYSPNSPIKTISLKNAKMLVKIYYYGNPNGLINVDTDQLQEMALFDKRYRDNTGVALEVLSIASEGLYGVHCSGDAGIRKDDILIVCRKQ